MVKCPENQPLLELTVADGPTVYQSDRGLFTKKSKLLSRCVTDVNAMKLAPILLSGIAAMPFLAIVNADVFSFFLKKFVAHTWMAQISDLRMMPVVIPTAAQAKRFEKLAKTAVELKRLQFAGEQPSNELAALVRTLSAGLIAAAPAYLRPGAQMERLATVDDCLAIVELAVNWETEKLYGVEGLGTV